MPIDDTQFKQALSRWATGVSIVTVSHLDERHGMTVSSFTSVSLSPPLISVCLDHTAHTLRLVGLAGGFAVNVLAADQSALSNRFASTSIDDRFDGVPTLEGGRGSVLIDGAIMQLECVVRAMHVTGDHTIVVGEVERSYTHAGAPLLYYFGSYGDFAAQP